MMTREEQIRVAEQQLDYNLTQMRVWQDQNRCENGQSFTKHAADLAQTLIYLRNIPNPFGVETVDPAAKRKGRKLDLSEGRNNDDA